MKTTDVAVGIILDSTQSKVLVAQRNTDDEHYGHWEFPGGKMNSGESIEDALKRELKEELNIEISASKPFDDLTYTYPQQKVKLHFFLVTEFSRKPEGKEGQKIEWISVKNLSQLDMLHANKNIVVQLQSMFVER